MKFHLFQFQEDLFFAATTTHITKLTNMLDKYCPLSIIKHHQFDIDPNYKHHQANQDINFLDDNDFFSYFNHTFKQYNIKNNWFKHDNIQTFLDYINLFIPNNTPEPQNTHENNTNSFKCMKCNTILSSLNYLNRHLLTCKGLTCEICNAKFTNKYNYETHIKNCGIFTCKKCNATFNSKNKYKKHYDNCNKEMPIVNSSINENNPN
jgi:hypothetical protein